MNIDEFIYVAEDRLDKDFCKHCIEKFNKDDNRYQGIVGSGENLEIKRSMVCNAIFLLLDGWDPLILK